MKKKITPLVLTLLLCSIATPCFALSTTPVKKITTTPVYSMQNVAISLINNKNKNLYEDLKRVELTIKYISLAEKNLSYKYYKLAKDNVKLIQNEAKKTLLEKRILKFEQNHVY